MEIFSASRQWSERPADERFATLEAAWAAAKAYADGAREKNVPFADLRVEARGEDLALVGRAGVPAGLTNYAFRQLAGRATAPAGYLQSLPATLAAQNLNYGLKGLPGDAALLFHQNGGLVLRAATTTKYERVWNHEVLGRMINFSERHNLAPAGQTFSWGGGAVPENTDKAVYVSDHDMFAFVMDPEKVVIDPVGQPMRRGVIAVNSEVGDKSLQLMSFLFRDVCANHIIWGASSVTEVRLNHVGNVRDRMRGGWADVRKYLDGAASIDEAAMVRARVRIGGTKEEVLDALFGVRSLRLSRRVLEASYDAVVPDEDGDANTVWGMAQGITRHSQTITYADERQELDRAAGRLLELTF